MGSSRVRVRVRLGVHNKIYEQCPVLELSKSEKDGARQGVTCGISSEMMESGMGLKSQKVALLFSKGMRSLSVLFGLVFRN